MSKLPRYDYAIHAIEGLEKYVEKCAKDIDTRSMIKNISRSVDNLVHIEDDIRDMFENDEKSLISNKKFNKNYFRPPLDELLAEGAKLKTMRKEFQKITKHYDGLFANANALVRIRREFITYVSALNKMINKVEDMHVVYSCATENREKLKEEIKQRKIKAAKDAEEIKESSDNVRSQKMVARLNNEKVILKPLPIGEPLITLNETDRKVFESCFTMSKRERDMMLVRMLFGIDCPKRNLSQSSEHVGLSNSYSSRIRDQFLRKIMQPVNHKRLEGDLKKLKFVKNQNN